MADQQFYHNRGPFTVEELALIGQGCVAQASLAGRLIYDVAPLSKAGDKDISFLDNPKYIAEFALAKAGACVVHPQYAEKAPSDMALILSEAPYRTYALIAASFYPSAAPATVGVHPTAVVAESARLGADVVIGPYTVVGENVVLGDGVILGAHVAIGDGVRIGAHTQVGAQAVISHSIIGKKVIIFPGVKLGQAGFGFYMDQRGHIPVPQLGRVIVEDQVEIGANTTIDRGTIEDTVIGQGTRIDNLVQIGHNVQIGRGCVLVAQVGIAGSTKFGDYVIAAGQVGVGGHLKIGNRVKIAAKSGIMRDIGDDEVVAGFPAVPVKQWHRRNVILSRLGKGEKND